MKWQRVSRCRNSGEHRLLACAFRLPAETHLPGAAAEPALSLPNGSAAESVAAPKVFGVEVLAVGLALSEIQGVSQSVVKIDPEIMSGAPCFAGTRVPIQNLIDYLEGGESIEDFLEGFPTVSREQVIAFLEEAKARMLAPAAE